MIDNKASYSILKSYTPVKIIIGENGIGKSTILNDLAKLYLSSGFNVIAIANSIYDKFNIRNKRFNLLAAKRGKRLAKDNFTKFLKSYGSDKSDNYSFDSRDVASKILRVLEYLGYDSRIGVKVNFKKNMNINFGWYHIHNIVDYIEYQQVDTDMKLAEIEIDTIKRFIFAVERISTISDGLFWVNLKVNDNYYIESALDIIKAETILRKYKIINSIDIFLCKNNQEISLTAASSGELNLLTSMMYIAVMLKEDKTVLIIDEPEVSLHPQWQREYIAFMLDLFSLYKPQIIVATHSPLVASCLEEKSVFTLTRMNNEIISKELSEEENIESVLGNMFGVITPKSHFLSQSIIKIFNEVNDNTTSIDDATKMMDNLFTEVSDDRQRKLLNESKKLLHKILKQD